MIRATMQLTEPEKADATITITMSLREWRAVMRQLPASEWPAWRVGEVIAKLLGQAQTGYSETLEYSE